MFRNETSSCHLGTSSFNNPCHAQELVLRRSTFCFSPSLFCFFLLFFVLLFSAVVLCCCAVLLMVVGTVSRRRKKIACPSLLHLQTDVCMIMYVCMYVGMYLLAFTSSKLHGGQSSHKTQNYRTAFLLAHQKKKTFTSSKCS